jgi:hypothetical protein
MSAPATRPAIERYTTTKKQRAVLREAFVEVSRMAFNDLMQGDTSSPDWRPDRFSVFGTAMPAHDLARYTQRVCRNFLVCLTVAASKLSEPVWRPFACVAEEMAVYAFIKWAREYLRQRGQPNADLAYERLMDEVLEDADFLSLFHPVHPAAASTQPALRGKKPNSARLDVEDWFKPFQAQTPLHPCVVGPDGD